MLGRHHLRPLAALALAAAPAACDTLTGDDPPEGARVTVTATASTARLPVVTSTSFSVSGGQVTLLEADTQTVAVPLDRRYALDERRRFFVAVGPATEGDTLTVEMRVWIDDRPWFEERRTLGAGAPGVITFVYRFSRPRL